MINSDDLRRNGKDVFCGLVSKQIVKEGVGRLLLSDCYVHLTMKMFMDGAPQPILIAEHSYDDLLIKQLSHLMPIGLRLAVSGMIQGETAHIWVDSLMAYGGQGLNYGDWCNKAIRPNTDLLYEVRLIRCRPIELAIAWDEMSALNERPRIENMPAAVDKLLNEAVETRKAGKHLIAYNLLCAVVRQLYSMRIDAERDPELEQRRMEATYIALEECAYCAMKLGRYAHASTLAKQMLQIVPDNARTYCILGQAYFALGKSEAAEINIRRAHHFDICNERYKQLLQEIQQYISLVEDEDDADIIREAKEDYEEFAEALQIKLDANRKKLLKKLSHLINNADGANKITLKGGFPEDMLDEVYERLTKDHSTLLEAKRTEKAVEIVLLPEDK